MVTGWRYYCDMINFDVGLYLQIFQVQLGIDTVTTVSTCVNLLSLHSSGTEMFLFELFPWTI